VLTIEAYFDESGSHDGSPVLCVAGYLFDKTRAQALDLAWKGVLDRYSLPFFHMVDCAHGAEPFDKLTKLERVDAEKEIIGLIRENILFGVAIAVDEREYDKLFRPGNPFGTAYSYCCWTCLTAIHNWIGLHTLDAKIAYFFEAGHKHQNEANAMDGTHFRRP